MSAAHTPTPWMLGNRMSYGRDLCLRGVSGGNGGWFIELHDFADDEQFDANAEFIVRAVNMHEALIAALKGAIAELNEWCEEESGESYNNPGFNDLLAKAEGRS